MQIAKSEIRNPKFSLGVTLLELLIAVTIFAFLCALLAGLLNVSLNLWRSGEQQGDIYDRHQIILEQIRQDFESIYAEKESYELVKNIITKTPLPDYISNNEPSLYVDRDQAGNYWCYLVRTAHKDFYTFASGMPSRQFQRVLYYLKPDPQTGSTSLVRTVLDQTQAEQFWFKGNPIDTWPEGKSTTVFEDILYLGITLLGEDKSGIWNSLPPNAKNLEPGSPENIFVPEQFLPPAVKIELVFRPTVFPPPKIMLTQDISLDTKTLKVTAARGLPDPPAYLKIGNEWMHYTKWDYDTIQIDRRGARQTRAMSHPARTEVLYGETVKRVYYLTTTDDK